MGMDLFKEPCQCASGNGGIQAEFVCRLREAIGEIVDETKTASKFKWRDSADAGVVFVVQFNSEEMLKEVLIWAHVKRWAESVR